MKPKTEKPERSPLGFDILGIKASFNLLKSPYKICFAIFSAKKRLTPPQLNEATGIILSNFIKDHMTNLNTIAVIGGTGKSGTYLVKELLGRNYKVRLLVRNPEKSLPRNENLKIVFGDVSNPTSIRELIKRSQAVISTLGLGIPISPKTIFSETTKLLIKELQIQKLNRYIVLSSLNVDTELDQKSDPTKAATAFMYSNFPESTKDKQVEYNLLSKSNLDWIMVRSSMIELTDHKPDYSTSTIDCLGQKISASSLAEFLVDQLVSNDYLKKAPFIWNK